MANAYSVKVNSVVSDGSSIYLMLQIYTGTTELPPFQVSFDAATPYATILAYIQQIADNQPSQVTEVNALTGTSIAGA